MYLIGDYIPSHVAFSRGSDQGIITEILGQFSIFIIETYVYVPCVCRLVLMLKPFGPYGVHLRFLLFLQSQIRK